jgi:hypothetical protein
VSTLRAWLGVERAAEALDGLDDAVNVMQDRASVIFGPDVFTRLPGSSRSTGSVRTHSADCSTTTPC